MKTLLSKMITVFILMQLAISCQRVVDNSYQKFIIGEWKFILREPVIKTDSLLYIEIDDNQKVGYAFYETGICENKLGYFKQIDQQIYFLGTNTNYFIKKDTLKIFNLKERTWTCFKIFSLDTDTMTLMNDLFITKFVKLKYDIPETPLFDKIIVSSSGCYGSCPINDICVDINGDVFYYGQYYNTVTGLFRSKINIGDYLKIESNFRKSDLDNLKTYYCANWTDDETITVTFIKDNQIVKTISDYGRQAPAEFYWAYLPVHFLYQHVKLDSCLMDKNLPAYIYSFETQRDVCEITKSESFFLFMELYHGKEVQLNFDKKYTMQCKYNNGTDDFIVTDGRYYHFRWQKHDRAIDIGYDFIVKNKLRWQSKKQTGQ